VTFFIGVTRFGILKEIYGLNPGAKQVKELLESVLRTNYAVLALLLLQVIVASGSVRAVGQN
jgi:hypothetical protein